VTYVHLRVVLFDADPVRYQVKRVHSYSFQRRFNTSPTSPIAASPATLPPTPRPIVRATAPERYRVQFTIGAETHEQLRRLQALLRREIPDGDPGAIFARAVPLLLEKVEKAKLGAAAKPRLQHVYPSQDG
jgi:hypothetical protein